MLTVMRNTAVIRGKIILPGKGFFQAMVISEREVNIKQRALINFIGACPGIRLFKKDMPVIHPAISIKLIKRIIITEIRKIFHNEPDNLSVFLPGIISFR